MTAKFGFQVTVQERTIWFFPEDVNLAEGVAKAEAAVKDAVKAEIDRLKNTGGSDLTALYTSLTTTYPQIATEFNRLKQENKNLVDLDAQAKALENYANLIENEFSTIAQFGANAKSLITSLKQKLNTGVSYGWTRGAGEDPISLGTFEDLLNFIDEKIIKKLGLNFDTSDSFAAMVNGLPSPINGAISDLTTKAIFELDGIRLKIPGKGSTVPVKDAQGNPATDTSGKPILKPEPTQFEIAMLVNLVPLDLELGPFQLNRIYAKLGNFGAAEPATV